MRGSRNLVILFLITLVVFSLCGTVSAFSFAWGSDNSSYTPTPFADDWDNDDIDEVGVAWYNTTMSGTIWALDIDSDGLWDAGDLSWTLNAGEPGWTFLVGDWDGNGEAEAALYKDGNWYLDINGDGDWDGTPTDFVYGFGGAGFLPILGDWNATGNTRIGVVRGGEWYIDYNGNGYWDAEDKSTGWGDTGYFPVTGDWNGDGKSEIGCVLNGQWYLDNSGDYAWGTGDTLPFFGSTGYSWVVGDWDDDGTTEIGGFNTTSNKFNIDVDGDGVYDGGSEEVDVGASANGTAFAGRWQTAGGADKVGLYNASTMLWYIDITTPTTNFTANVTSGCAPATVSFTDTSTGSPTAWEWYINSDETADNTTRNATYTFTSTGVYNIRMRSSYLYPSWDWENKTAYVKINATPTAAFSGNVTSGYPPFAVLFTDASNNTPDNWDWYWNGDTTKDSDSQNPTATYNYTIGNSITTYNVSLYASNASCSGDWENKSAYITSYPLNASFNANITSGCGPLVVTFTDATNNGTATAWNWSFGDGTYASTRNATKNFTSPGLFNISLNASNSYSYDFENKTNYINVTALVPVANFTKDYAMGCAPREVIFNDTSTNNPTSWSWDVDGDGDEDYTTRNVTHTYTEAGPYSVNLKASTSCGFDWENKTNAVMIMDEPDDVDFITNVTSGYAPLAVLFEDNSTGLEGYSDPDFYYYDVDGDNVIDYSCTEMVCGSPTVEHVYTEPGLYTVNYYGYNTCGGSWENKTDYINVSCSPIEADFTSNVTSGYPSFAVQFNSTSTNSTAWDWYFPNGGDAHTRNATWTFDYNIGNTITTYNISLNASSDCGFTWENKTDYITAYPLHAVIGMETTDGYNYRFTDFTNNGTPTAWNWSFDDGTYSDSRNPIHTFPAVGLYNVIFNASNSYSWDLDNVTINVTKVPPVANFTTNVTSGYPSFVVNFTDTSVGVGITDWDWYVDGVKVSDLQSPEITFDDVIGNTITQYDVSLLVWNPWSDWYNVTDCITAYPLNASFSANVTIGDAPLAVKFTDATNNGTPTTWWWDFNEDGIQDDANQSPTYIFGTAGVYNVSLNASNAYSYSWYNLTDYITALYVPAPPFAAFTANTTSGYPNFTVQFTDTSGGGAPTDWDWYVDGVKFSDSQDPLYSFDDVIGNSIAQYDIFLYVSNIDGVDWQNETNYITAYPLNASFYGDPTLGTSPLVVDFYDLTGNGTPTAWYWQFGDGNTSLVQAPTHAYEPYGLFNVTLNASNAFSWDIEEKLFYINISANATPTPTPTPTSTPGGAVAGPSIITASSANVSNLSYPMIILFIGGLALTGIVGMVIWGRR